MSGHPYGHAALRRGAWQFLSGKAVSGLLTFLILLSIVRLLPLREYGAYATLIASAELAYAIGALGLHWAAARHLPEYRLHAPAGQVRTFAFRLLAWQVAALGTCAVLLGLALDGFLAGMGLEVARAAAWGWVFLVFTEGIGRFLCEGLLAPLIQQHVVRTSVLCRQVVFLALLGFAASRDNVTIREVLWAELAASVLMTALAFRGLRRHLSRLDAVHAAGNWREPAVREVWSTALPMYGAHLLTLAYSPQLFIVLLQRFAGGEAAAVFGFLRSLYEQAARYLPATLLFGLVRPKLVAAYVGGGGMAELAGNANLAGKLSLFVLMPVVGFAAVGGEALIALLSGGKFLHTGLLFFGFMLALVPFSQRQLLETVAVAAGQARLCPLGAAAGLSVLPLMLGLFFLGAGPWAGVAALGGGHLIFVLLVVAGLRRAGYRPDQAGLFKLGLAAGAGTLLAASLPRLSPAWLEVAVLAVAAGIAFLVASWAVKPFSAAERQCVHALLGRKVIHG